MHIMNQLFQAFEINQIPYAHFKSNPNLDYSFNHTGDFDVVVDPSKKLGVNSVLISLHAKQMNTINEKRYPGVDNWLLFDENSGKIHHLHLHYKLMSGKAYVKDYEIPWRDLLLETRVFDSTWHVYKSDPNIELLLLSVRMVIKSHLLDSIKALFGLYRTHTSLQSERAELLKEVEKDRLELYIQQLFTTDDIKQLASIVLSEKIGSKDFAVLSRIVRKELKYSRRCSGVQAQFFSIVNNLKYSYKRLKRKLGAFCLCKKTTMSRGAIIAFVGVDGSGKSTTSKEIYKWLSKQFDCMSVYMGLGDGKTTLLLKVLKHGRKLFGQMSNNDVSINSAKYEKKEPVSFIKKPKYYIRKRLLIAGLASTVKANNKKIKAMNTFRINGGITVLDRYPQIELPNVNDGPKIGAYRYVIKADSLISRLEKMEAKKMSIVKTIKPDIVFRLNITAEESMRRKDDQSDITLVQSKINDLKSITFQGAHIIDVDGMQPYEDELLEIKRIIWNYI